MYNTPTCRYFNNRVEMLFICVVIILVEESQVL